jgi:hypothetical protein
MRVHPRDNEAVNETWISDRDRFSYEGLNSDDPADRADDSRPAPTSRPLMTGSSLRWRASSSSLRERPAATCRARWPVCAALSMPARSEQTIRPACWRAI